jgi:hypothetical protein
MDKVDGILAMMEEIQPWIVLLGMGVSTALPIVQKGMAVINAAIAEGRDISRSEWNEVNLLTSTRLRRINSDTE